MSVITSYVRLTPESLSALRGDADWVETLEAGEVPGAAGMDIDKAGDAIVWLLSRLEGGTTPTGENLATLLSGEAGHPEPELESPYGDPAHLLSSGEVRAISTWLDSIEVARLRAAYEPLALARAGVYPQIWARQGVQAFERNLLPHFERLRHFLAEAVRTEQCVLVYFT